MRSVLPEFGSVTNPIDGTGAIYDNPALLPKIFDAILPEPGRPVIAASVSARPVGNEGMRRLASTYRRCRALLRSHDRGLSVQPARRAARSRYRRHAARGAHPVPARDRQCDAGSQVSADAAGYWARSARETAASEWNAGAERAAQAASHLGDCDFLAARNALLASGVPIVEADLASSEAGAVKLLRRFGYAVAVKAEAPGLLHKSELDCVRLHCASERDVTDAYQTVVANARKAGFADAQALIQPMIAGVAEAYAGIIDDPLFGPAVCFGLGGIFVEILKDTEIEMAPLIARRRHAR